MWLSRLEEYEGRLYRVADAYWQKGERKLDCYCEDIMSGDTWMRGNVLYSMMGYTVAFPGERMSRYYGYNYKAGIEPYGKAARTEICGGWNFVTDEAKDWISTHYPKYKYLMSKLSCKWFELPTILEMYDAHPECETLFQLGLNRLAVNKNLYKLSKPKLKQVLSFIKDNIEAFGHDSHEVKLRDIQTCIKMGITFEDYWTWQNFTGTCSKIPYEDFKYCQRKNISGAEYKDYLSMAQRCGHDIDDEYWRHPNNPIKAHDKLVEELKNVEMLNSKLKGQFLHEALVDLMKYNTTINGYDVFVTDRMDLIKEQCDKLHQCLITCDYVRKVIDQEEILVFFWKNNEPVATAEVFYDGRVGQFYTDESNRMACVASEELMEVLNIYLKQIKLKKRKFNYKMHFYKGFHDKIKEGVFHTSFGNATFIVGCVYETPFEDSQILAKGGSQCVSTNQVFHFCNSINEIKRHYNPSYYCEIEPLGPVLEHNGALLSNKIKIIRELTPDEVASMEV